MQRKLRIGQYKEDNMNYTVKDELYIANEGYVFKNKFNDYTCSIMKLANTDSIDNYEVIEKPIEEEPTNESLEDLSKEELIERLKEIEEG